MTHNTIKDDDLKGYCEQLIKTAQTKNYPEKVRSIPKKFINESDFSFTFQYRKHCFQIMGKHLFFWYNIKKFTHIEKISLPNTDQ